MAPKLQVTVRLTSAVATSVAGRTPSTANSSSQPVVTPGTDSVHNASVSKAVASSRMLPT